METLSLNDNTTKDLNSLNEIKTTSTIEEFIKSDLHSTNQPNNLQNHYDDDDESESEFVESDDDYEEDDEFEEGYEEDFDFDEDEEDDDDDDDDYDFEEEYAYLEESDINPITRIEKGRSFMNIAADMYHSASIKIENGTASEEDYRNYNRAMNYLMNN